MNKLYERLLYELGIEGDDDYIGLWEIASCLRADLNINIHKTTIADAKKLWNGLAEFIPLFLQSGFVAVTLRKDGGCDAWPDQDPVKVLAEIKRMYVEQQRGAEFGIWFNKINKTPKRRSL